MNYLSRYLGNAEISLTTTATDVEIPSDLLKSARVISLGCLFGGEFVKWEMVFEDELTGETFPDSKIMIPFNASPNQIPFKAKVPAGTGTLQIGFWR